MIRLLSWDCAYKTLGWASITVNTNIFAESDILSKKAEEAQAKGDLCAVCEILTAQRTLLQNWFVVEACGVSDVLPNRNVNDVKTVDRARALRDYLVTMNHTGYDIVLIEGQPPAITGEFTKKVNTKSTVVGQQLIYHFLDQNSTVISPRKKNGVCLAPHLQYDTWLAKRKNTHATRKEHAVCCVEYLSGYMSPAATVQYMALPATVRNNAADAILQVVAWLPNVVCARKRQRGQR